MKYLRNHFPYLNSLAADNKYYWLCLVALALTVLLFFWYQITSNPQIHYLSSTGNANWIVADSSFSENARPYKRNVKLFKTSFKVTSPDIDIHLNVRAFKFFRVFIDDRLVYESDTKPENWKKLHRINISSLQQGKHELIIPVMNYNGPSALIAYSTELSLKTDQTWLVGTTGSDWTAVALAVAPRVSEISTQFQPAYTKILGTVPIGFLACLGAFLLFHFLKQKQYQYSTGHLRWFLLVCWLILAVDSMINTKIMGYDWTDHMKYIEYILTENSLPLATDGWQMFQSPLFYIISAFLVKFSNIFFSVQTSFFLLKLIPLFCGIALVEICYRCARLVYQDREDLQSICLLSGAMMPMNLYMSQFIGNESLLAFFSAASVLILMKWIKQPELVTSSKQHLLLGFLLGLALLSKVTALILVGIAMITLVVIQRQISSSPKAILVSCLRVLLMVGVIGGWYYLRNWVLLGKPFMGGWDPERGALMSWWQEPGFRHVGNFINFGQALIYPIYSATHSLIDGFYSTLWADGLLGSQATYETRPPWNYNFILATIWLSLVPTAGLLVALFAPVRKKAIDLNSNSIVLFCCSGVLLYLLAITYLYLKLPIYSTVKASYSLGLLPCYAILITVGLSRFMKNKVLKRGILGLLIWWSTCSYLGYFSLGIAM